MNVPTVNFLGEQDGRSERELKTVLVQTFTKLGSVSAAYLARVEYGPPSEQHVALCLVTDDEANPTEIVSAVNSVFYAMFSSGVHLDVLPLSKEQQSRISLVCRPFFTRYTQ